MITIKPLRIADKIKIEKIFKDIGKIDWLTHQVKNDFYNECYNCYYYKSHARDNFLMFLDRNFKRLMSLKKSEMHQERLNMYMKQQIYETFHFVDKFHIEKDNITGVKMIKGYN